MTEQNTTAAPEGAAQTGLTIQDLTLVLQVIQVSSTRGAFKADELTAIGGLYDRIFKFLESTGAISKVPPEGQQAPAPTMGAPAAPTPVVTQAPTKKSKAK